VYIIYGLFLEWYYLFNLLISKLLYDNFKYSSLYIIRLNQKFIISIITIFLTIFLIFLSIIVVFYIMDYFDIMRLRDHILCEGSDSVDVSNSNSSNDSSNNSPNESSNPSIMEECASAR